ncbi:MAG: hypothetical protein ACXQTD_03930 [Candidatus Syntropharchaeia archaeon]
MDVKKAVTDYQLAERIKSEIIIASKLLGGLSGFEEKHFEGGKKLFVLFLEALLAEIRLSQNIVKSKNFSDAENKIMETIGRVESSQFEEASECVAKALSHITTSAQRSMEVLMKEGLI